MLVFAELASASHVLHQPPSPLPGLTAMPEAWGMSCCPGLCSFQLQEQAVLACEAAEAVGCGD